jgi:hypothetical protein
MKRNYDNKVAELPSTYAAVLASDAAAAVADAVRVHRPMVFVGSGGALAVARLAADLHIRTTGQLARAMTPLESATAELGPEVGLVLFSARGRHPDAALAVSSARLRAAQHLAVVSCRTRDELPEALRVGDCCVATVPSPPDGFLATNSLIAMSTAVCLAHNAEMPDRLPAFDQEDPLPVRHDCLVLTTPGTAAVGLDIEARLSETGLATVQLTDYRNLTHGRHVGLMRRRGDLSVIATIEPEFNEIARRTLDLLPGGVDLRKMASPLSWPSSVVDLLVQSIRLAATTGRERSIDPGRPGVQDFGRRLYHLPVSRHLSRNAPDPISRKIAAGLADAALRPDVQDAFDAWNSVVRSAEFGGVVLDCDGTCYPTWDRFRPPPADIQEQLIRLLNVGVVVGFATGRGSIHRDTRSWLPRRYWDQVHVGLYNGTVVTTLDQEPPLPSDPVGALADAASRLEETLRAMIGVERRATQLSIKSKSGRAAGAQILPIVQAILARDPPIPCKAVESGRHSVDVLLISSSKVAVLDAVEAAASGLVLAIGDQGHLGGNDFDLLAARVSTLSVDRCSPDPTRCWNIDRKGFRGPELTARYLAALRPQGPRIRFDWRVR